MCIPHASPARPRQKCVGSIPLGHIKSYPHKSSSIRINQQQSLNDKNTTMLSNIWIAPNLSGNQKLKIYRTNILSVYYTTVAKIGT